MNNRDFLTEDLESFAKHLGLDGIDSDLFYESYYGLNNREDVYEYEWDEYRRHS